MTKPHSFAARLQDLRHSKKMSKSALARAVGVTPTCVWNWEAGNTEPRPENFTALGQVLEVSPAYLERGQTTSEAQSERALPENTLSDSSTMTLAEVIAEAKILIGLKAGLPADNVKISLDY